MPALIVPYDQEISLDFIKVYIEHFQVSQSDIQDNRKSHAGDSDEGMAGALAKALAMRSQHIQVSGKYNIGSVKIKKCLYIYKR